MSVCAQSQALSLFVGNRGGESLDLVLEKYDQQQWVPIPTRTVLCRESVRATSGESPPVGRSLFPSNGIGLACRFPRADIKLPLCFSAGFKGPVSARPHLPRKIGILGT